MKINENGRSMIEMLGVLAIIGVLSVGGIAGYSKAMSKYRTNKAIDQATMLITNIRTMFAQQQSYLGLNNARAVNLALVPEEMIVNPNDDKEDSAENGATGRLLRNVFGGEVEITTSPIDASDQEQQGTGLTTDSKYQGSFVVTFKGLSRDACIQIATSDWGAGSSSGLVGMQISGDKDATKAPYVEKKLNTVFKEGTGSGPTVAVPGAAYYRIPFSVVQAQFACDCRNSTTCTIQWKYF